jgi:hypothetical protein
LESETKSIKVLSLRKSMKSPTTDICKAANLPQKHR